MTHKASEVYIRKDIGTEIQKSLDVYICSAFGIHVIASFPSVVCSKYSSQTTKILLKVM